MSLPRKLLVEGEEQVLTVRTHVKTLFWPVVALLVVAAVLGFALARVGGAGDGVPRWILLGLAVVLLLWWTVLPFWRWYAWTYTLTTRRIVEQKGIVTRTGRVIPLNRINDVSYEKNLDDRLLGCGTLIIHDASEQAGLQLRDIPGIEHVHRTITTLIDDVHHDRPHERDRDV